MNPNNARRFRSRFLRTVALGALLSGLWVWNAAGARAQQSSALQVTVLRSTTAEAAGVADTVDAALVRDLTAIAGIEAPQLSPMEYEEIRLTVGCQDQSRDCLAAIAGVAQVGGLVVRSLSVSEGALRLGLIYFDAASHDAPAHAQTEVAKDDPDALTAAVPSLVRELFGIPEVPASVPASTTGPSDTPATAPANPAPSRVEQGAGSGLVIASIATFAVGAGVTLAGVILGASASASFDDYKTTTVTDRASASAASQHFDDAESKATWANVLIPVGGAMLVGGAVLLVLGLKDGDDADGHADMQVAVAPLPDGAAVALAGAW